MRLMFWTGFWVFAIDQMIKFYVLFSVFGLSWAQVRVPSDQLPYPASVEVFPPFLTLRMAWNRGINFGLFADFDMRWVLIGVAFAITGAVIWWLSRSPATKWVYIAGGFLIGGGVLLLIGAGITYNIQDWWAFILIGIGLVVIYRGMADRGSNPIP